MIKACLINDDKHLFLELKSFDAACSSLCSNLPIDIRYGKFSLITCVNFFPRDIFPYVFPDICIKHSAHEHVLLFKDFRINGGSYRVLEPDLVNSIAKITQIKRSFSEEPCKSCAKKKCLIDL